MCWEQWWMPSSTKLDTARVAVMQSSERNILDGQQQTAMSNILEASNYGGSAEQYEAAEDQFTKLWISWHH